MTQDTPKLARLKFPATNLDEALLDLLAASEPPARWCALNAIRHLNGAWTLRNIDCEMAILRSITAEEEAAKAVFLTLQRHEYPGAKQLNVNLHWHKLALTPFLDATVKRRHILAPLYQTISLSLDRTKKPPRLDVEFRWRHPPLDEYGVRPEPPLHFLIKHRNGFLDPSGIKEHLTNPETAKKIVSNLKARGSARTQLLYAAPNGIPGVNPPIDDALRQGQRITFRTLKLFLLIDPYPTHQYLVQLGLDSFLYALQLAPPNLDELLEGAWPL
jgi:hypothetical protein